MGRHKKSHKTSTVRQQGRRKASSHLARRKKKETGGRAQKQKGKRQQQLPENPQTPPSTSERKLPSVNLLEDSSSDDDEDKPTDYELLLSTFKPLAKKPRLMGGEREKMKDTSIRNISGGEEDFREIVEEGGEGEVIEVREGEGLAGSDADNDSCSDDGGANNDAGIDPFSEHVEQDLDEGEVEQLKKTFSQPPSYRQEEHPTLGLVSTATCLSGRDTTITSCSSVSLKRLHVKQRLANLWSPGTKDSSRERATPKLSSPLQESLFAIMNSYKDVLFTRRTFTNGEEIRRIYLLHALNHVLKTRSRVLKNNAKLTHAAKEGKSDLELRDQGLIRPKVLIILPFREAALRTVNMIISLLLPPGEGQVSHRKRFLEEFSEEEHLPSKVPKPVSYQELFSGNIDDCFRVGVAVKRNTIRLYTKFYSSDIIIASPLGLRTIIGAEGEKNRDYDFLSSLELVIVDQADVYLMQNWDHLLHLFSHLHLQPRDSHGTDFSRVRMWSLNGWANFYRQTLVFSSFPTPEINSLFNTHCHNYAGKVKVCELRYPGSVAMVALQLPQTFHRVQCESHLHLPQARWTYFIEKVLSEFSSELMKQTAIFIPSYFDFVRLRNHMKREEMNFVPLSEHTSSSDVSRGRSHFFHGHTHFLLYTERMHFFKRYHIRGIKHLIFYSLPTYCEFYPELVNMLEGAGQVGGATCTVLYSTYDALALSRIVGSVRAAKMVKSSEDIQTLISGTH